VKGGLTVLFSHAAYTGGVLDGLATDTMFWCVKSGGVVEKRMGKKEERGKRSL
jgi:hypothetical protein